MNYIPITYLSTTVSDYPEDKELTPISGDCAYEYEVSDFHAKMIKGWFEDLDKQSFGEQTKAIISAYLHGFAMGCGYSSDVSKEINFLSSMVKFYRVRDGE